MNKLQGILKLEELGLPHAKWQIVRNASELKPLDEKEAPLGWIVRSCLVDGGYEINLPYRISLSKEEVSKTIEEFQKKLKGKGVFVIWKVWDFVKSGSVLLLPKELILEGVKGYVEPLTDGKRCDLTLRYTRDAKSKPDYRHNFYKGNINLLNFHERKKILDCTYNLPLFNHCLEWSFNTWGEFYFHDIMEIK